MNEHIWVEEALGGYLAGGLDGAERERLERHVAECGDCARELEQARGIDGRLDGLFAPIRPAAALEDRLIRAIREQPLRRRFRISGWKRVLAAAAAVMLFGGVGAAFTAFMENEPEDQPVFRRELRDGAQAENNLKQLSVMLADVSGSMQANDFESGVYASMRGVSIVDGSVRYAEKSLGEFWVGNPWDKAGGNVPTGSMATELWGRKTKSNGRSPEPGDGVPLGMDWGADLGSPPSTFGLGFSPDGRSLASAGKKRVHDAKTDPLVTTDIDPAAREPGQDINFNLERKAEVPVPGQANALEQLKERQRTAQAQTRLGKSGGEKEKSSVGANEMAWRRGLNNPTKAVADSLIASEKKPADSAPQAYFRPGELFADKTPMNLPAPAGLSDKEKGRPVTETAPVTVTKKTVLGVRPAENAFDPADLAFAQGKGKDPKKDPAKSPRVDNRKIIRSGEIEFEVESFDDAVAVILKLVNASNGGFVATINSDKLANGKVRGAVVVRVPPEELDDLVKNLRKEIGKAGELKGQKIGSQDVTKQYTDMESRLKAARTMEERLLNIIKSGKGEIKDLVAAEKELGVWRTKIEELEGEIRYYSNQIALSTLTVNLTEKDIRLASAVSERERVQTGIEVDDVEKSYQEAQKVIAELKGRITRSELKQGTAGQFNALLYFEVAPDSAGPMRDRLRQLGNMVRLEIDRVQHAEGTGKMPLTGKLNRGDTQFQVSLYNLANVQPRETVTLKLAAADVAKAFRDLREAVAKVKGRIVNSQLNEQDRQNVTGALEFHIRRDSEAALQAVFAEVGEQLSRQVTRVPESDNVTDAKVLYKLDLAPATAIPPRETMTLVLEINDVATTFRAFNDEVREAGGRVVQPPKLRQERTGKILGRAVYDVPLSSATTTFEKFKATGRTSVSEITPNPNAPDGKLAIARIEVVAGNGELLVPRDQGLWAEVRHGLATSLRGLSVSAGWLIIGVLFVLPWLVLLYVVVWATRKLIRRSAGTGT